MFVNSDFSDLLRLFNDNQVRYLVVCGYAVLVNSKQVQERHLHTQSVVRCENVRRQQH